MNKLDVFSVTSKIAAFLILLTAVTASNVSGVIAHSYSFSAMDSIMCVGGCPPLTVAINGSGTFSAPDTTGLAQATGTILYKATEGGTEQFSCIISSAQVLIPFTSIKLIGVVELGVLTKLILFDATPGSRCSLTITEGTTPISGTVFDPTSDEPDMARDNLRAVGISFDGTSLVIIT